MLGRMVEAVVRGEDVTNDMLESAARNVTKAVYSVLELSILVRLVV